LSPEAVAAICAHMNDDHADSIAHYARIFGGCRDVVSARMDTMDADSMTLAVVTTDARETVRVPFDHRLRDADDARDTLIAMARRTHAP
jgi:putative heme iron utilization protein